MDGDDFWALLSGGAGQKAMADETHAPLSAERLAAMRERVELCYRLHFTDEQYSLSAVYPDLPHDYTCDVEDLLADNDRLHAREAAAMDEEARLSAKHSALFAVAQEIDAERGAYPKHSFSAAHYGGVMAGIDRAMGIIKRRLDKYEQALADLAAEQQPPAGEER